MTTFTDAGLVELTIKAGGKETTVTIDVYETEAKLYDLYAKWKAEDKDREAAGKTPLGLVDVLADYRAVFDPLGVPTLSAGGYKHLADWVHDQTGAGQKKSLYYASAESPSSTASGPGD